jgi:hypothetical protein
MYSDVRAVTELVERESAFVDSIVNEVGRVVVGQEPMVERLLIRAAASTLVNRISQKSRYVAESAGRLMRPIRDTPGQPV